MVCNVISLHKVSGQDGVKFPFSINDYQRYVFGDDKLAHHFGTCLAKAFIAHNPGAGTTQDPATVSNHGSDSGLAVAVLSAHVPTATHNLREHFTAYLNRHLISNNRRPARKVDLVGVSNGCPARNEPQASPHSTYHVDSLYLGSRSLVVLGDIRMRPDQEETISQSFKLQNMDNTIAFAYLATIDPTINTPALSSTLSSMINPSIKDIDNLAHSRYFAMTEEFARSVLGRDFTEFCRFLRGQDDFLARKLLDYAIAGDFLDDELYKRNLKFLLWEIDARESI